MSFSIVIQLEAKRAAQPRRPTLRIGRGAGSGSDCAESSVAGRAASKAAGWYIRRSEATAPAVGRSAAMAAGV
jgi:hypothetical protein